LKRKQYACGLKAALEVAGGKWKVLVPWNLAAGPRRFGDSRQLLPGISEKMLIQTLCEMQDDGIVVQKDYRELPPRVVYSLSVFGKSLTEALRPLCEWGTKHVARIAALLKSAHPS
jgi:DNA-binding HxlR family transcriptional regulator